MYFAIKIFYLINKPKPMKRINYLLLFSFLFLYISCKKSSDRPPINDSVDLDGKLIFDSSLNSPANFLLSAAIPNPDSTTLLKPVIICAHGYTACNFEWTEFRNFIKQKSNALVSLVLLGGHGRTYDEFKASSWQDWQQPIIDEFNRLRSMGYKKISLAGSSTGGTLILDMLSDNKINFDVLRHVFMIDPIIIPANKTLSTVSVAGSFVSYIEVELESGENGFWYKYRPEETLKELEEITTKKRETLESGFKLPTGVTLTVYKSKKDPTVDANSAVLIKQGVKNADGSEIEVKMIESNLHVFTRLHGRNTYLQSDIDLQQQTFNEMYSRIQ